jgi:L-alanine-DL-glutamate epimerase-like enolase superfamily enzyme
MRDELVESVEASTYTVPTDAPEANGTLSWDSTTMILVTVRAGGASGIGWTYGPAACAAVITDMLAGIVRGRSVLDVSGAFEAMVRAVRNAGRPGAVGYAISAVDVALWDLKAPSTPPAVSSSPTQRRLAWALPCALLMPSGTGPGRAGWLEPAR